MLVVRNLPVLVHEGVGPFGVFVVNGGVNEYVQPDIAVVAVEFERFSSARSIIYICKSAECSSWFIKTA